MLTEITRRLLMARKAKTRTFTFEIPEDSMETFKKFQELAGADERSAAALLRVLMRGYVDGQEAKPTP